MENRKDFREPLAYRMAPTSLSEFVGQEEILAPGKLLYRMIVADRISSIILYGPPGTGKTSIARIIANTTKTDFKKLNAVTSGIADIKRIIEDARNTLLNENGKSVLFIDEIHRFNKAQQDALLPAVEDGTVVLVGATTENPFFEVNKALISRSRVFMLKPLEARHIVTVIRNALTDEIKGIAFLNIRMEDDAITYLSGISGGDARFALNTLELAALTTDPDQEGFTDITVDTINECIQKKPVVFDKTGEGHYDNISAFIKSMRGSDPDAAVFYLARMLYAGEDPVFIARRIIICASEDVGMANPAALQTAVAAAEAVRIIGMPEARIILSQAAVAVAVSPKSNASYMAINAALKDVESRYTGEVPMHIRNSPAKGMEALGYGKGYLYAHDFPGNYVNQRFLPEEMVGTIYYNPTENGNEKRIKDWLESIRKREQE